MKAIYSKMKRKIKYNLLLLFLLLLWGMGITYGQFVEENYQSVNVSIPGEGVTWRIIERALENEVMKNAGSIPTITAWNCLAKQQVENESLATTEETRLLKVCGDMKQVYPMELVKGVIPVKEDSKGCLVDKNTAYELFRTSEVIGNVITFQKKEYYIRGVIDTREKIVILPETDVNYPFSNLELVYEDKECGEQLANEFMVQNDLADSYVVLDTCFYSGIMRLFYSLPVWTLGFYLLFMMIKSIWKRRTNPLQFILLCIIFFMAWQGMKWVMDYKLYLPDRLIPTKWSDFSFWQRKYKEQTDYFQELSYLIPVPKNVLWYSLIRRCIFYSLISTVGSIFIIAHKKMFMKSSNFLISIISCFLLESIAIFFLYSTGRVFTVTRGYMLMLPLFLAVLTVRNTYYIENQIKYIEKR